MRENSNPLGILFTLFFKKNPLVFTEIHQYFVKL